jgi:uncharacterized protein (DUF1800 family)
MHVRVRWTAPAFAAVLILAAASPLPLTAAGPFMRGVRLQADQPADQFAAEDRAIVHVLNRLAFGPRPGDLDRVKAIGIEAYIEQQLYPERLPDTSMARRLDGLTTLGLSSREIAEQFALPALQARRERQQTAASDAERPPQMANTARRQANRVLAELTAQKILRAAYSERQLQEVLTDFWFNHFNVDARKGQTRFMLTEYERDAIRPHVLGSFRDLLEATAKSPAMLFYLDNWMSAAPDASREPARRPRLLGRAAPGRATATGMPALAQRNRPTGLNENYARELMELHTLGVDGGYTQMDVTEVARAFTGWTIRNPRLGGGYAFDPRMHDDGRKVVLGHAIEEGGEEDGERVLDILAAHPSTARFISTKLAVRFVGDRPPPALVDRLAATFGETDGNLREVMRVLLTSPEFLSPDSYRAKVKTPFEFVVSAVRAMEIDIRNAAPLAAALQQLGMPLYLCQPPTGYSDTADAWVNTGALVGRLNFALQLSRGALRGLSSSPAAGSATRIVRTVLNDDVSETTRDTIARATTAEQELALAIGSPEFQRR